ncbi:hypothetical protein [Paenibacillus kobensis]|uniref:hypothetical protein n=1 Tax=Paenibacillus kobensis TaxID=59841 RepID=UPI000FD9F3B8|nr:hypothetical protein [Paenibacillus kobensis]
MKRLSLQSLIIVILAFSIFAPIASAEKKVKGDANPYGLEVQAWTANGITEVTVHAYALDSMAAPPSGIQALDITAYDAADKKLFTQSYNAKDKLTIYETLKLQADKKGKQVSKVLVEASVPVGPGDKKNNTKGYTLAAEAAVKARPDLTLVNASAQLSVKADEPFTVHVDVKELSGQSGATGRIDLLNGGQVLASYNELTVGPGQTIPVTFSSQLNEAGDYTVAIRIIKTDIAQSDVTNDQAFVNVHVEPAEVDAMPLSIMNAQYIYSAAFEEHYEKLRDGIFVEGFHNTNGKSEAFMLDTNVPGGILQGGSIAVELHGQTTGKTYSFEWSNLVGDVGGEESYYQLDDSNRGISLHIIDSPDGNIVSINKNAGNYDGNYFYNGMWQISNSLNGEYAIEEKNAVDYTIKISNNQGETYVNAGTIALQYVPLVQDTQWVWQNESNRAWGFHTNYEGQVSSN